MKRDPNTRVVQRPPEGDVVYKQRVSKIVFHYHNSPLITGFCEILTTTNTTGWWNHYCPRKTTSWTTT
jgi:hypothetical protein